jgi:hypothetical protein
LTHNPSLAKYNAIKDWEHDAPVELKSYFDFVLKADQDAASLRPHNNLFWFSIMKPKVDSISLDTLKRWSYEEEKRESLSTRNGLLYYAPTTVHESLYGNVR